MELRCHENIDAPLVYLAPCCKIEYLLCTNSKMLGIITLEKLAFSASKTGSVPSYPVQKVQSLLTYNMHYSFILGHIPSGMYASSSK